MLWLKACLVLPETCPWKGGRWDHKIGRSPSLNKKWLTEQSQSWRYLIQDLMLSLPEAACSLAEQLCPLGSFSFTAEPKSCFLAIFIICSSPVFGLGTENLDLTARNVGILILEGLCNLNMHYS